MERPLLVLVSVWRNLQARFAPSHGREVAGTAGVLPECAVHMTLTTVAMSAENTAIMLMTVHELEEEVAAVVVVAVHLAGDLGLAHTIAAVAVVAAAGIATVLAPHLDLVLLAGLVHVPAAVALKIKSERIKALGWPDTGNYHLIACH